MDIAEKLPTLENDALAALHTNAKRLMESGTEAQQTAAAALLPSIVTELAARNAAKLSTLRAKAKAPSKTASKSASKSPSKSSSPKRTRKAKPAEASA